VNNISLVGSELIYGEKCVFCGEFVKICPVLWEIHGKSLKNLWTFSKFIISCGISVHLSLMEDGQFYNGTCHSIEIVN